MKLGALILVASETDFRLGKLVQYFLIGVVHLVAIGARNTVGLMRAARPECARKDV